MKHPAAKKKTELSCKVVSDSILSSPVAEEKRAEELMKAGQVQTYCDTCKLAVWPAESRICPRFKPSPELEAFYKIQENQSNE